VGINGRIWGYYQFAVPVTVSLTNGGTVEKDRFTSQCLGPTTVYVDYIDQAAPVPEPEAWGLMPAGLALVGAAARRRRR